MTVIYGSNVANGTITTACSCATANGGTETTKTSTVTTGTGNWAECTSQGKSVSPATTYTPQTGNGWAYQPGAGTFAAGVWSAAINMGCSVSISNSQLAMSWYKYSSGSYSLIGSANSATATQTTAKMSRPITSASLSAMTFLATDWLYFDCWMNDPTGMGAENPIVYESTSATTGVTGDMVITTPTFTPAGGGSVRTLPRKHHSFGRIR